MDDPIFRVCTRCICNTTIPGIVFDVNGVCNFCHEHDERDFTYPLNTNGKRTLDMFIKSMKKSGKGNMYDCIIGVSGGTDSTYCLYLAKQWGLRPLAVHFDNGWNSEIAVSNINKATRYFDIDLHTWVTDWEEFRDLQIAFLRASVPEADMPTDIAYLAALYKTAVQEKIRYIITGSNFRTEGKQPLSWSYGDGKYILSVYRKFGKKHHLEQTPNITLLDLLNYHIIKRIRLIKPLYFIDYRKSEAMKILNKEVGWEYYGGHHFENTYTRFIHGYYLPEKFGIDNRLIEYSALIRSHQMTREEAMERIQEPCYPRELVEEDTRFVLNKLGMSRTDLEEIMNQPNKSFMDYKTYYPVIIKLRFFLSLAQKLGLYPDKIYGKYSY